MLKSSTVLGIAGVLLTIVLGLFLVVMLGTDDAPRQEAAQEEAAYSQNYSICEFCGQSIPSEQIETHRNNAHQEELKIRQGGESTYGNE